MDVNTKTAEQIRGGAFLIEDAGEIFVPEECTEEQEMIRQMAKDFVDTHARVNGHILEQQVPLMDIAGELGLLSAHMPEAYGGMGLDTNTNTIISEEIFNVIIGIILAHINC